VRVSSLKVAVRPVQSGGDFLIDAEVLFDRGDASKGVIDFLTEDIADIKSTI
jgi:hypothetical protein